MLILLPLMINVSTWLLIILISLQEKSPLKYSIVCSASAISPINIAKEEDCILKLQRFVDVLYRKKRLSGKSAWNHSFSSYAKFLEKLTFLTPLIRTLTFAYQGVRNVTFFGRFCVHTK